MSRHGRTASNQLRIDSYEKHAPHHEENVALARVGVAEATERFETAKRGDSPGLARA